MGSLGRVAAILALFAGTILVYAQQPGPAGKPDKFSPLGFYDLLAYEQAYPAEVGSPQVRQASSTKYWTFQGVAYRGTAASSGAWISLGPLTSIAGGHSVSGRVSAIAISPTCSTTGRCRLWVGTAGGGVWRTDDAMSNDDAKWRWTGRGLGTNSIGSLTVDPTDKTGNTIYVGTGETNSPNNSGAGTGLYRSIDGGDHWTRIATNIVDTAVAPGAIDFTFTRGISDVVVDPTNGQRLYVATTTAMLGMTAVRGGQTQTTGFPQPRVGLYKTENRGGSWTLIWVPPLDPVLPVNPNLGAGVGDTMAGVKHVKLDPRNAQIIYATAFNNAIHRSAPSLESGDAAFKPVYAVVGLQRFQDLANFDLTVKNGHTRIYVYNGTANAASQALYRLDNADVRAASLVTGSGASLTNTASWIKLSSDDPTKSGFVSRQICAAQCFYDIVAAVPEGQPDTVILGGVQATLGEATIRSTNAGVGFFGFGNDAQNPRTSSHVDVRVVVFHPKNPAIAFVGSDGGVVRNDGSFTSNSSRCPQLFPGNSLCASVLSSVPTKLTFLNKGLQTLQFFNVSIDPQAPLKRQIGGLQDNSTIWQDGTGDPLVWKTLFGFGDGTSASGFHPTRSEVQFASFQSNNFYTNFRNGDQSRWVRTGDPIIAAGERQSVTSTTGRQFLAFDPVSPDTQFTGFQHIWRTPDNGGSQAALESKCGFPSGGTASPICGDWVPLGVAFPFVIGTTPDSVSRKPGDLTSDYYGIDRVGGLIVAAERTRADSGTLWAATNFGRLFISKNADANGADVQFVRIDTPMTPNRFVTRIVVDRTDPNVALISYSGFNAITPAQPGHIFRAVYDPSAQAATFTLLDADLGDLPINTLAYDDLRGDLYAGTDFGPLILRNGSATWDVAGVGFPEALMVDLEIVPEQRLLVAATHGLGIFYLWLPKVAAVPAPVSSKGAPLRVLRGSNRQASESRKDPERHHRP
jgi:hypothetical protein